MKKLFKTASTLALAFALCMGLAPAAFAAGSSVSFKDYEEVFVLVGGSEYSATDLFDGFKNIMPGDELRQVVSVGNDHSNEVNIYMRAVPHGDDNPLIYDEEFEAQDGKDQDGVEGVRDETIATMLDFLAQLEMTINWNGSAIYEGPVPPAGGPEEAVLLGAFAPGESKDLEVVLSVPIEMGNDYMNRVGEVDWVFTVEELDPEDPPTPPTPPVDPGDPEDPPVPPVDPGDPTPGDPDPQKPWLPVTGDNAPLAVLAGVCVVSALVVVFAAIKRRSEGR